MSSSSSDGDLEEIASDRAAFCAAAHKQILEDVTEDLTTTAGALRLLSGVKRRLLNVYNEAFVPQALPEALSFYVSYALLWWDPLEHCMRRRGAHSVSGDPLPLPSWGPGKPNSDTELEGFGWFADLAPFSEIMGDDDPDCNLVPQLVQRCVFPEVARRLRDCWNVTSLRQSHRVAALLDECLLFDTVSEVGAHAGLQDAAFQRLQTGLAECAPQVFVPNEVIPRWYRSAARWRLLWRCCKIARCALALQGRLPDERLSWLVLSAIFATRIAPHLQSPRLDGREMDFVERFVSQLPQSWFMEGLPAVLVQLRDVLGPRAPTGPRAAATAESAVRVLHLLRCFDEAQVLKDSLCVSVATS